MYSEVPLQIKTNKLNTPNLPSIKYLITLWCLPSLSLGLMRHTHDVTTMLISIPNLNEVTPCPPYLPEGPGIDLPRNKRFPKLGQRWMKAKICEALERLMSTASASASVSAREINGHIQGDPQMSCAQNVLFDKFAHRSVILFAE